ncbi:hypothetical protein QY97_02521 [Bacillus thermotolerans]|nr:hypothetical protein QY97_02521 [Bacillus thermotolerans]
MVQAVHWGGLSVYRQKAERACLFEKLALYVREDQATSQT